MTIKRYGKDNSSLLSHKTSFFEDNQMHINKQKEMREVYLKQPRREKCKNCNTKFKDKVDFIKDSIEYIICEQCCHLNGAYEDTESFCEQIYTIESGAKYAENYKEDDLFNYNQRTTDIYIPKAEFLLNILSSIDLKLNPYGLRYLDFGGGVGFFVSAMKKMGVSNIKGTDVSYSQVEYGNNMIGEKLLSTHTLEETINFIERVNTDVISMIGVLEHLKTPRDVLKGIKNNKNIKYIYISLPLFSLSVFLEIISTEVFHRQLSGGHTHLYTEESIKYFCKEFGFEIIGEWWFGTDVVDLFRHISVTLESESNSSRELFKHKFLPLINALQLEVDKKHFSSELHLVLKKN